MEETANQQLILVNEQDEVIGSIEKISAHRDGGQLHRAFSVLIFNSQDEMLLQLRSTKKYHFGGLWTNACCGHPLSNESVEESAARRLHEEFGFHTALKESFTFFYEAHDPNSGLSEKEWDHVVEGVFDGTPIPNAAEIDDYRWVAPDALLDDVNRNPGRYTPWFQILLQKRF